ENIAIHTVAPIDEEEILGINDRMQLAQLESFYQQQGIKQLMEQGVTLHDPKRIYLRCDLNIGKDVKFDVDVVLEGTINIGAGCEIGPFVHMRNTTLADNVKIKAHCVLDGAVIGANAVIGPFAHLRPGTTLAKDVHVGNFVE